MEPDQAQVITTGDYQYDSKSNEMIPQLTDQQMMEKAMTSPALQHQSNRGDRFDYPANYRGKVPLKVKPAKNVRPDIPFLSTKPGTVAKQDEVYYAWVNSHGAVSAILPNGEMMGLIPSEFDVVEFHPEENVKIA